MSKRVIVRLGSREYNVELDGATASIDGAHIRIDAAETDEKGGLTIRSGGRVVHAVYEAAEEDGLVVFRGRELALSFETERHRLLKRFASTHLAMHSHAEIKASMPGMVVRVTVAAGDQVAKGQAVLILEAMKMENEVRAPIDGTVREIIVAPGKAVEKGDLLMVLDS